MKKFLRRGALVLVVLVVVRVVVGCFAPQLNINDVTTGATPLYPDVQPQRFAKPATAVFDAASAVAHAEGWDVTQEDRTAGTIQAVATTNLMRFKDDVMITIAAAGDERPSTSAPTRASARAISAPTPAASGRSRRTSPHVSAASRRKRTSRRAPERPRRDTRASERGELPMVAWLRPSRPESADSLRRERRSVNAQTSSDVRKVRRIGALCADPYASRPRRGLRRASP